MTDHQKAGSSTPNSDSVRSGQALGDQGNSPMTTTEALREVGLVGSGAALDDLDAELLTEDERNALLRALADFGTDERLAALDILRGLVERAERDAELLDGREFDESRFAEAYGLLALLRAKELEAA